MKYNPNHFQLVGWFTFGTFLILKGAFLNSVYEQKQSGGSYGYGRTFGRSFTLTEELGYGTGPEEIYFDLPYIEEWTVSARNFSLRTDSRTCHFHTNWNVKLSFSCPYMPVTVSPFPVHIICLFLRVSSWSSRWTTHSRDVTSNANPVSLGTSRERWDFNFFIF